MSPTRRRRAKSSCVPYPNRKIRCDRKLPRHTCSMRAVYEESHQRAQGPLNHNLFSDDSARRVVVLEQQVQRLREEQARRTHLLAIVRKAANTPVIQGVGIPVHLITRQYRLVPSAGSVGAAGHRQRQTGSLGFLPCQIMVPKMLGSSTSQFARQ
ncbi:hypothetical protein BT69DRAFT_168141 [Atractiella rhizophila]|nr:hypothetical protein BT69DRAFT_168141 [Atractiella rhizophila]